MSDWLEHSQQIEVAVPVEVAWQLWSDLERMPEWMTWIKAVQISEEDPEISRWKLASGAFEFSWQARTFKQIPNQIIQWESIDGLPNRGAIRFYDRKTEGSVVVKMSIAFKIPGLVGQVMDNLFLGQVVEANIRGDLNRFRDYALQLHQR